MLPCRLSLVGPTACRRHLSRACQRVCLSLLLLVGCLSLLLVRVVVRLLTGRVCLLLAVLAVLLVALLVMEVRRLVLLGMVKAHRVLAGIGDRVRRLLVVLVLLLYLALLWFTVRQ